MIALRNSVASFQGRTSGDRRDREENLVERSHKYAEICYQKTRALNRCLDVPPVLGGPQFYFSTFLIFYFP